MDELIEKIIQNPLFLKLKNTVENNSYHDHEDAYTHSIKVKDIAQKEVLGDFITNPEAKELFLQFTNENIGKMKKAELMILTALLHDIGKMLTVKEGDKTHPLLVTNSGGITSCPGHEYWGSTIVGQVIEDLSLSKEIVNLIANVIKLHDNFGADYFAGRSDWTMEMLLDDIKSKAEGLYKEALFNIYCDCFHAVPFQQSKEMIVKIFNEPKLYGKREYLIP